MKPMTAAEMCQAIELARLEVRNVELCYILDRVRDCKGVATFGETTLVDRHTVELQSLGYKVETLVINSHVNYTQKELVPEVKFLGFKIKDAIIETLPVYTNSTYVKVSACCGKEDK